MGDQAQVLDYISRMRGSLRSGGSRMPAPDSLYRALPPVQGRMADTTATGQLTRTHPKVLAEVIQWLRGLGRPDTVNTMR